eukprot:Skav217837  [mRNA]  locus=scaffold889:575599:584718:+ [translate_table: standard]
MEQVDRLLGEEVRKEEKIARLAKELEQQTGKMSELSFESLTELVRIAKSSREEANCWGKFWDYAWPTAIKTLEEIAVD